MNADKPSERRILRLLESIAICQAAVERNRNAPVPSPLAVDEYEDQLGRLKIELARLMLSYGLRYVPEDSTA